MTVDLTLSALVFVGSVATMITAVLLARRYPRGGRRP